MNFHIFSMVWGEHHVDLFKRACFKSLCWPKNHAVLKGATWKIYTKKEHFEDLGSLVTKAGFNVVFIPIEESLPVPGCGIIPIKQLDAGVILLHGLRNELHDVFSNREKTLFAPPDTIFGDGTVPNLLNLGREPATCVAVSHPRVTPGILDEIDEIGATRGAIDNPNLVTLAFKHSHESWKMAEVGHEKNTSFLGGIAWKKLSDGLYSVQHRLPTHYFCHFDEFDWTFWWAQNSFGAFDHRWPGENLIRQQRQRYCGSSDACFIVEVTDWDKNVPNFIDRSRIPDKSEDAYYGMNFHHGINRQFSAIFRGE